MAAGPWIFTSTFVGYTFAFPGVAAYAASKSGLIGLTQALAAEFGPRGVLVNATSCRAWSRPMYREMNDTADKQAFITNHGAETGGAAGGARTSRCYTSPPMILLS